jgi:hypothetical protein
MQINICGSAGRTALVTSIYPTNGHSKAMWISLSHASVRKETGRCGELIEDAQFYVGWSAGGLTQGGAEHLRVALDGTVLTATPSQEVS